MMCLDRHAMDSLLETRSLLLIFAIAFVKLEFFLSVTNSFVYSSLDTTSSRTTAVDFHASLLLPTRLLSHVYSRSTPLELPTHAARYGLDPDRIALRISTR